MPNIVIGLSLAGGVLVWVVVRYFAVVKKQQREAKAQHLKDEKYKRVLEKARLAEHEEKVFKAQTGHIPSLLSLAKEYELSNIRVAIGWYRKAADQGNDIALNALARLCRLDIGDPEGEAKSQYWENVINAKSGEAQALFELGRYQIWGYGTEVDVETGVGNLTASAEQGHTGAQLFLGDWYVAEANLEKAPLLAYSWRIRAAISHDAKGCLKTAFCYQAGIGVAKDRARTLYWLERAAEQGIAEAQFLAAKMHLGSDANDAAVAYIWFSIAYASGHKSAQKERDNLLPLIGIESILSVQGVANSVYKILRQKPLQPHTVIELLDKIYGRQGYRPSEDMLAALAAGEFTAETGQTGSVAGYDSGDEQAIGLNSSQDKQGREPEKPEAERTGLEAVLPGSPNQTATQEYQQQRWATSWDSSWDSLAAETKNP